MLLCLGALSLSLLSKLGVTKLAASHPMSLHKGSSTHQNFLEAQTGLTCGRSQRFSYHMPRMAGQVVADGPASMTSKGFSHSLIFTRPTKCRYVNYPCIRHEHADDFFAPAFTANRHCLNLQSPSQSLLPLAQATLARQNSDGNQNLRQSVQLVHQLRFSELRTCQRLETPSRHCR